MRTRGAKRKYDAYMGGVGTVACGDMLQLPPVKRAPLAEPLDAEGRYMSKKSPKKPECSAPLPKRRKISAKESSKEEKMGKDADEEAMELAASEHRSGLDLWHRFDTVVVLSLNVRSGGVLGDLLQELRDGPLSDASWSILEERLLGWYRQDGVLTPLPSGRIDPRLQKPPFSNNVVHFVVARHKIRAAQAFHNAMATASRLGVPVFVVKALDVAKQEEAHLFTEQWHTKLLDNADLSFCKRTPGILALYHGMDLVLNSKDCVRFGLMNGCECRLEQILFADTEQLPEDPVAGAVYELEYLPVALLLRANGAAWTLPPDLLPHLARDVDTRGLFLLRAQPVSLSLEVAPDRYIQIKRLGFQVAPADVRIDYGAQGETWDAVLGDLARPPKVDVGIHWLHVYVILSRATSLEGFLALRLPSRADLESRPPQYLLDEMSRLLSLEKSSTVRLKAYLDTLECPIPQDVLRLFDPDAVEREAAEVASSHPNRPNLATVTPTVQPTRKRLRQKTALVPSANLQISGMLSAPGQSACATSGYDPLGEPSLLSDKRFCIHLPTTSRPKLFVQCYVHGSFQCHAAHRVSGHM